MLAAEITLDGFKYSISYVDARTGLRAGARVTNALAHALTSDKAKNPTALVAELFANPGLSDLLDYLVTTFAAVTVVHAPGKGPQPLERILDDHFTGRYGALLQWLLAATEGNLSSFLDGATAISGRLKGAVSQSASPPSAEMSGPSGDSP